ncbi:chaperone NapD [Natroniella sulfidigena]|uniref:chaperone NapD n=1 Tax=Natroniella sulfidigena TaxID=723921 RepID=UPI00200A1BF1|nr:chaperone NapD [Natroniella sulfidigena]MCK8818222.1 chaperone NapD [Natroniella sulfidigena]
MLIAGILVEYENEYEQEVLDAIRALDDMTVYETEEGGKIAVVIEAESRKVIEEKTSRLGELDKVIIALPVYVNYEEELEKI